MEHEEWPVLVTDLIAARDDPYDKLCSAPLQLTAKSDDIATINEEFGNAKAGRHQEYTVYGVRVMEVVKSGLD